MYSFYVSLTCATVGIKYKLVLVLLKSSLLVTLNDSDVDLKKVNVVIIEIKINCNCFGRMCTAWERVLATHSKNFIVIYGNHLHFVAFKFHFNKTTTDYVVMMIRLYHITFT